MAAEGEEGQQVAEVHVEENSDDEEFLMVDTAAAVRSVDMAATEDFLSEHATEASVQADSVADEEEEQEAQEAQESQSVRDEAEEAQQDGAEEVQQDGAQETQIEQEQELLEAMAATTVVGDEQLWAKLCAALQRPNVVEALQAFCGEGAVADMLVEIGRSQSVHDGVVANMGDLMMSLGRLLNVAPELAELVPEALLLLHRKDEAVEAPAEVPVEAPAEVFGEATVEAPVQPEVPPRATAPAIEPVVHVHVLCDGCKTEEQLAASERDGNREGRYIRGARWKSAIIEDFDLCSTCEASGRFQDSHGPFLKITQRKEVPRELIVVLRDDDDFNGNKPSRCRRRRGGHGRARYAPGPLPYYAQRKPDVVEQLKCPVGAHPLARFRPTTGYTCDVCGAKFVADVSIPDGSVLLPGTEFDKTWRVENPSDTFWPGDVVLVCVGGERMDAQPLELPAIAPHSILNINLRLVAPAQPGRYVGYFRLMTRNSQHRFGHRLWVDITVPMPRFYENLLELRDMGFTTQDTQLLQLLEQEDGDLEK
ncbi:Protein JOKA2 (Protein NBR1 homolog), partial [Durusdinium trenchii]